MRLRLAAIPIAACLFGVSARAGTDLAIDGAVAHPLQLSEADLQAMPATELDVSFMTAHGQETAHYKGVLLWSLLDKAGLPPEPGKPQHFSLRHCVMVSARDGYAVTVAIAEVDPDLEGKQVLVAFERDGKPLTPDELRLVVPGDKHGGRAVREVNHLEVK